MSDLSHTIVVTPNLFMRFFIWFYDCAGAKLNTCLLFWGVLGMILLWPFRLLLAVIMAIGMALEPLVRRIQERDQKADAKLVKYTPFEDIEPKKPSTLLSLLTRFAHAGGLFWYKFQTPLTWTFRIVVGLALLAFAAFAVYGLTTIAWSWVILWDTLISLGVILGTLILGIVVVVLGGRWTRNRPKKHTIRRIYRSVHDHTCANVVIANTNTENGGEPIFTQEA